MFPRPQNGFNCLVLSNNFQILSLWGYSLTWTKALGFFSFSLLTLWPRYARILLLNCLKGKRNFRNSYFFNRRTFIRVYIQSPDCAEIFLILQCCYIYSLLAKKSEEELIKYCRGDWGNLLSLFFSCMQIIFLVWTINIYNFFFPVFYVVSSSFSDFNESNWTFW